jgi:hypothetical protein
MPFAGTFNAVLPGETRPFSIDFINDIAAGDTIASASATIESFYGVDENVALLPAPGPPGIVGTTVIQTLGFGPYGFQPGIIYRWTVKAETAGGWVLISFAHLPCRAVA